jgi:hypothetical protein
VHEFDGMQIKRGVAVGGVTVVIVAEAGLELNDPKLFRVF